MGLVPDGCHKKRGLGQIMASYITCPGGTVQECSAAMVGLCENYDWLKDLVIHPLQLKRIFHPDCSGEVDVLFKRIVIYIIQKARSED